MSEFASSPAGDASDSPPPWIERGLLPPKAFYFCYYAAMSCLIPYLTLYYRDVGLTGPQIGFLAGLAPIITWLAAPLWGAAADAYNRHRTLLITAMLGAMVMVAMLSRASELLWLTCVVAVYAFFAAPIMPLVDNSVMVQLGERSALYGRQRVWGAIGWGIAGTVAGVLIEHYGLVFSFYAFLTMMGLGLFAANRLVVQDVSIGQPLWAGLRTLLVNRALVVFLLTVLFASMGSSVVHNFLFLYMQELGAGGTLMGLSLTIATLSEMPVFFFSAWLLRKFGARGLLLLALGAFVARLFAYSLISTPVLVLPINLLHGLTFAAMWVAGVSYANRAAPQGYGATAQGLFTGIAMGLGAALGALLGGVLFDNLGPAAMYRAAALWVAAGFVFFLLVGRRARDIQPAA